jgi:hypothetical protein
VAEYALAEDRCKPSLALSVAVSRPDHFRRMSRNSFGLESSRRFLMAKFLAGYGLVD